MLSTKKRHIVGMIISIMIIFSLTFLMAQTQDDSTTVTKVDSVEIIRNEILKNPGDLNLKLIFADFLIRSEMLDEAEALYKEMLEIDSLSVKAHTGLGRVHFNRQPSKIIPWERLKELFKKDHRSKAIMQFKKALEIDPNYLPARYYLGRSYLEKDDESSLQAAEAQFKFLMEKDEAYRDIVYQLGHTYQKMGKYQEALAYFRGISETSADYARARIRMAEIYFETGNYELSTTNYYEAMETLEDAEILDYLFDEQKILLTDEEKTLFESTPYQDKKHVFKSFWKRRDPDPSTVENERLTEHFRRVKFARENFHFTAPPYYDDRGKIYIKYGKPDGRYNSPMGNIPAKDNESWSYENVEKGLVFDFVSEGGYYRQVQDLTEAALAGYGFDQRLYLAGNLYYDRSHLSQTYANLSANFSMDRLNNYHVKRSEALDKYPGEIYRPDKRLYQFPFITKWAQFKDDQSNKTRVEFYSSFPGIVLSPDGKDEQMLKNLDFFIEITDSVFDQVIKEEKRYAYEISSSEQLADRHFLFQNDYLIEEGTYSAAIVLSDVEENTKGVKREEITVADFDSDELMLSSLQLSSLIEPVKNPDSDIFVKNGLSITPYAFYRVVRKKPIYLYFEIYNLSFDDQGTTDYEIAYTVETIKPQRNFWQKTIGSIGRMFSGPKENVITISSARSGEERDTFEYMALDLKNLPNGETVLTVNVTDQNSNVDVQSSIEMLLIN